MVFDTVVGDSLERSWPLLRANGRAITIAGDAEKTSDDRVKAAFVIVEPNHQQLSDVGPLFEAGYLRPFVGATASLLSAPEEYRGGRIRLDARQNHYSAVMSRIYRTKAEQTLSLYSERLLASSDRGADEQEASGGTPRVISCAISFAREGTIKSFAVGPCRRGDPLEVVTP